MTTIKTDDSAIRIKSESGDSLVVDVDGWQGGEVVESATVDVAVPVDEVISGRLTRVRVPTNTPMIRSPDVDLSTYLGETTVLTAAGYPLSDTVSLPVATYRLTFHQNSLSLYLEFEAAAELVDRLKSPWVVSFDQPTEVRLAVRDTADHPRGSVTAESTPAGVARALTTLSAGLRTTTPDRSFPSLRIHPPRIKIGSETQIPKAVSKRVPETGIEVVTPRRIDSLLAVSPLVHYLCADLRVTDRDTPLLRAPAVGFKHQLGGDSSGRQTGRGTDNNNSSRFDSVSAAVGKVLERVFWLDCLVRNAGPHGVELSVVDRAREAGLSLDAEALYDADPAARLAAYFEADYTSVSELFPRWQVGAVVPPTVESVPAIPRLSFGLAKVFVTDNKTNAPVLGGTVGNSTTPPSTPPATGPGDTRVGCRVVMETPGSWEATPSALRQFEQTTDGALRVAVAGERADAAIRDRIDPADPGITVTRPSPLTRSRFHEMLSDPLEVLYYADNEQSGGFNCTDGVVSVEHLPETVAEVAVLDTPASLSVGRELVATDRVATAVVRASDGDATLGIDTVRWLLLRVRAGDAVWLTRRYGSADENARVVGDPFRQLRVQSEQFPSYYWYDGDTTGGGQLGSLARQGGHQILQRSRGPGEITLVGLPVATPLSSRALRQGFFDPDSPVIHNGQVYWDDEARQLLDPLV
jgi:hypothetical protein